MSPRKLIKHLQKEYVNYQIVCEDYRTKKFKNTDKDMLKLTGVLEWALGSKVIAPGTWKPMVFRRAKTFHAKKKRVQQLVGKVLNDVSIHTVDALGLGYYYTQLFLKSK